MSALVIAAAVAALSARPQSASAAPPADCREWHECRQMALGAYARGEFERFHDLAWRTVQTGPARDPHLMYLLARAQSLSGRPHDALVMLGRLAEVGFVSDAATNDDFRAVRQLRQWPELEAKLTPAAVQPAPPLPPPTASSDATESSSRPRIPSVRPNPPAPPAAAPAPATSAAATVPPASPVAVSPYLTEEALRVPGMVLNSTSLAYDRASSRFVVADAGERKVVIIDERSRHLVDLVTSASAGFYDITAIEIDPLRGTLWVVSAEPGGAAADRPPATALHRLQLVSGRPLERVLVPDALQPSRLEDVAVAPDGAALVLDTVGHRILRLSTATHSFSTVAAFHLDGAMSLAPVDDRTVYVAHGSGIARVDISTGAVTPLGSSRDLPLGGLERIRWMRDSLLGIQRLPDGSRRAVRIRFANGRAAAIDVIESGIPATDGHAATVSGSDFYFLVHQPSGGSKDAVVRRARLR